MGWSKLYPPMVAKRTCPLCFEERREDGRELLGPRCKDKVFGRARIKTIGDDQLLISLFPYQYPPLKKIIVQAKTLYQPNALRLLLQLWDRGLQLLPELPLKNAHLVGVPRPLSRQILSGTGLVPHLMRNALFSQSQKLNVLKAYSNWRPNGPRTSFRLAGTRDLQHQSSGRWVVVDDLYTTGETLYKIKREIVNVCLDAAYHPNILALTLAYARE